MHATFGLEPAIGVVALDLDGSGLDAGFFAVVHFKHVDLHVPALSPAGVHAQEHVSPILALGAAGARVDFDVAIVAVDFAGKKSLDLPPACRLLELDQGLFGIADDVGIAFGFT